MSDSVTVETKRSSISDKIQPSVMIQKMYNYTSRIEKKRPSWSSDEIIASIRDNIEHGLFGDLRALLYPATHANGVPVTNISYPTSPFDRAAGYSTYNTHLHYSQPEIAPPARAYEGTINPATLTAILDPVAQYGFIDELNRPDSFHGDSDSTYPETPYNYVRLPCLLPELTFQEIDAYVTTQIPLAYPLSSTEYYPTYRAF